MKRLVLFFLAFYGLERLFETFWRREKIKGGITSPYSIHLLVGAYLLLYATLIWESVRLENREFSPWLTFSGLTMVALSVAGRNWAIHTLGPYHSIHIEIRDNHKLIQSGPYKYVRNPYYSSVILEAVGLPLVANAFVGALISVFVYLPILVFRIALEEKALEEKFKESFKDYKSRAPRMFPKLF